MFNEDLPQKTEVGRVFAEKNTKKTDEAIWVHVNCSKPENQRVGTKFR